MVLGAFLLNLLVRLTGLINLRESDVVSISNSILFWSAKIEHKLLNVFEIY